MTERRCDPLTGEWRTILPDRQHRTFLPPGDDCPLCPGGLEVPAGQSDVFVFDNRFPPFSATAPAPSVTGDGLYAVTPAAGASEVVVYSPDHHATLAELGLERIARIVEVWAERTAVLARRPGIEHVFVFENRGEAVGVSLHHPHGQIYGLPEVPPLVRRELERSRVGCASCAVAARDDERVVVADGSFVAAVPFAPRLPYEVHITARDHVPSLVELGPDDRGRLAAVLQAVVQRYDRLFGFVLPYVLSVHQAPVAPVWRDAAHLRVQLTPLHRSADRLKHLAGAELHAGVFLVDVAPEQAAARLRSA